MRIKRLTFAEDDLFTLGKAKEYLRVDSDDENSLIRSLIKAATDAAEKYCIRSFLSQKFRVVLDNSPDIDNRHADTVVSLVSGFASSVDLPNGNVISIDAINSYSRDNSKTLFPSSNYFLDDSGLYPRVILNDGAVWPTNLRALASMEFDYTSGYGEDAEDVPESITSAIKIILAHFYEKRGDEMEGDKLKIPMIAQQILNPYKVFTLG